MHLPRLAAFAVLALSGAAALLAEDGANAWLR